MLKLGTIVVETATQRKGMLTHLNIMSDGSKQYCFQPHGLSEKRRIPLDAMWVTADRIQDGIEIPEMDLPTEIFGSEVTDDASGFTGKAVGLQVHINGCVHVWIQSSEANESGNLIPEMNFDIRRLSGEKIKQMTEEELELSHKTKPSPTPSNNPKAKRAN